MRISLCFGVTAITVFKSLNFKIEILSKLNVFCSWLAVTCRDSDLKKADLLLRQRFFAGEYFVWYIGVFFTTPMPKVYNFASMMLESPFSARYHIYLEEGNYIR
jgi:hypothetical protein